MPTQALQAAALDFSSLWLWQIMPML